MHDPWDGHWPLVCDWDCHLARGSAGGDDYGLTEGTAITAAFSGTLHNRVTYPAGYPALYTAILTSDADPKLAFYHLHLSRFVAEGHYNEGDVIGYSGGIKGATGSGTATGPHLHVNAYYGGVIRDVHDFFNSVPAGDATPIIELEEDDMKVIHLAVTNDGKPNGSFAVVSATKAKIIGKYNADGLATIWGPIIEVTEDAWTAQMQIVAAAPGIIPS